MSSENTFDDQLQKAANLARIRDNQRRSRARRKEYLQELEERYRVCEQLGVEASAEMQAAARRVIDENRRLRSLLKQHGYTDAAIDRAVFEGSSSTTAAPVAGLEALFGQRKMPQYTRDPSTSVMPLDTSSLMSSTGPPSSVSSSALGVGQSSGQMGHMYQQPSAYPDASLEDARHTSQISQHGMPYGAAAAAHWDNLYPREYTAQHVQSGSSNMRGHQQHFDVPSLQSIKSEIGYGSQEEIDDVDADEPGHEMRQGYHR